MNPPNEEEVRRVLATLEPTKKPKKPWITTTGEKPLDVDEVLRKSEGDYLIGKQ